MNIGLWKTKSEKGTEYYRGTKNGVEIGDKKYKVSVFINSNKKTEKSPDMSVVLTEIEEKKEESTQEIPQNVKTEYKDSDITIDDSDLPF